MHRNLPNDTDFFTRPICFPFPEKTDESSPNCVSSERLFLENVLGETKNTQLNVISAYCLAGKILTVLSELIYLLTLLLVLIESSGQS